jgi:hypothetical protein
MFSIGGSPTCCGLLTCSAVIDSEDGGSMFAETLVDLYQNAQHHIPEDGTLYHSAVQQVELSSIEKSGRAHAMRSLR